MTPIITDMDLPDDVVEAAYDARIRAQAQRGTSELSADEVLECEAAAIRAALQAMCDCGMARAGPVYIWSPDGIFFGPRKEDARTPYDVETLLIRLDADERKRALQEERK